MRATGAGGTVALDAPAVAAAVSAAAAVLRPLRGSSDRDRAPAVPARKERRSILIFMFPLWPCGQDCVEARRFCCVPIEMRVARPVVIVDVGNHEAITDFDDELDGLLARPGGENGILENIGVVGDAIDGQD